VTVPADQAGWIELLRASPAAFNAALRSALTTRLSPMPAA